jgi:hypothetical protein
LIPHKNILAKTQNIKAMKNLIKIFLISQLLISGTCRKESDSCHQKINFKNNSNESIFIHESYTYPRKSLSGTYALFPNPLSQPQIYEVKPGETNIEATRTRGGDCFESRFGTDLLPSDTTIIYVFDRNVLQTVSWDTIREHDLYLKRYDLSLQDLKNGNWTITYQ